MARQLISESAKPDINLLGAKVSVQVFPLEADGTIHGAKMTKYLGVLEYLVIGPDDITFSISGFRAKVDSNKNVIEFYKFREVTR